MKKLLLLLSYTLLLSSCSLQEKSEISQLEAQLTNVTSSEEEESILVELWNIAYENIDINLHLSAIDNKGNEVINNLENAIPPVTVSLTLSTKKWSEKIQFTPLDIENVYVLLNE